MTDDKREQIQEDFVYELVDGMDLQTISRLVVDMLAQHYDSYSDEQLYTEVKDLYPELLENKNDQESERNRS